MKFIACVTTRNRPEKLSTCLKSLWASSIKPLKVVVSDDSSDKAILAKNKAVVREHSDTKYIQGPRRGVCANRNNAFSYASEADIVSFIDDDVCIESDFVELAIKKYEYFLKKERMPILSGVHRDQKPSQMVPLKLSFRGYFCPADKPQAVVIPAAVFPKALLDIEKWDEKIFFGYEDAELCLRALRQGYQILHCPELKIVDTGADCSTLNESKDFQGLTNYRVYTEASRLYVGIKRFKYIEPNSLKLFAFLILFVTHMPIYLMRRKSLHVFPEIFRRSNVSWRKLIV